MENQSFSEDIRHYLGILWHWGWLLIIMTVIFGGATYVYNNQLTPVYQTSTRLLVNEGPATRNADYASVLTSERLARTYSELLVTNQILNKVISNLGIDMQTDELQDALNIQIIRDTQLIDVKVDDTNPIRAAAIANEIVNVFRKVNKDQQDARFKESKDRLSAAIEENQKQIQKSTSDLEALGSSPDDESKRSSLEASITLYRQIDATLQQSYEQVRVTESSTKSTIEQVEMAKVPTIPVRPQTTRNTILGALVGLILAGGLVVMIEFLDDTLSPDTVTRQLGIPILGFIARYQLENGKPIVAAQPRAPVSEAFRSLRTNIQFTGVDRTLRTLLVTSPSPEDGKSTIAANLAVSLAQSGQKVIILDADLRRPQVHNRFELSERAGLTNLFIESESSIMSVVQSTVVPNLWAITSGNLPPNPAELLGSKKMIEILGQASKQADIVIIDSPPITAVTDAAVLSTCVDGVLMVVKPGTTKIAAARQSVEQLKRIGANLLGIVLNDINVNRSLYKYNYYKGYYSTYQRYYGREPEALATD